MAKESEDESNYQIYRGLVSEKIIGAVAGNDLIPIWSQDGYSDTELMDHLVRIKAWARVTASEEIIKAREKSG